jgi:trehalose 2-sulfotransferase
MGVAENLAASGKRFYCICFSIRSGSTLLTRDLTNWSLGAPREPFQTPQYQIELEPSTAQYIARLVEESPGEFFGFKVTWGQAAALLRRLRDEDPSHSYADLAGLFPGLRYIHLVRNDKVAQAVSAWRAGESGTWHWPTGVQVDLGTPPYDFLAIRARLLQFLAEDWLWNSYFERHNVSVLRVDYETYVEHRLTTMRRIATDLGSVRPGPLSAGLQIMRDGWTEDTIRRVWIDLARASELGHPQLVETITIGSSELVEPIAPISLSHPRRDPEVARK